MDLNKQNKFQTPLTEELINILPKEVYASIIDYISTVEHIHWLIQPEEIRGFAKDRPFMVDRGVIDPRGRKVIDITKPHILEDMDYFRERAIFFENNGRYTNITPNGNPKSEYAEFWREEKRRWKDGYVRESDGEWIPGELYFYWNYAPIWLTEEINAPLTTEEWVAKITSYDDGKDEDSSNSKTKGERKREFPKPWLGDYLFFHYVAQGKDRGQHGKLLKTRGVGFSFKTGSWSPRNMYVYPGSGNPNFHLASDKGFLSGDKGIWGKVLDTLDWIAEHTPFPRMKLVDGKKAMELQLGYEDEYGTRKGLLSSVYGISLKDNPDKARGIRGPLIHYEEDGLFPNLEKAWNVNRKAVEDGDVSFGYMLAGGTGGTEGASFEGSEKLFYNPGVFNIYGVPNRYDKNTNGGTKCGFFWGAYLNRNNCYDENNGEPDVIKALIEILCNRYTIRKHSTDPTAITQAMAEEPLVPQEAVMRTEGTIFPVADLKEYLSEVMPNLNSFVGQHYVGNLVYKGNGLEIDVFSEATPIRDYPIRDNKNKEGCIEIFQKPYRDSEGNVARGRYIAGCDPYDDDESSTNSLGSLFIMDALTEQIVAEYTGRPRTATEFYENVYRLLVYYNAICNYENDKKGLFSYFDQKNALYLLCDNPTILKDMDMMKPNYYGNKAKGTNSGTQINRWGRRLQADWLVAPAYFQEAEEGEEEDKNKGKLNLHTVRSVGYLKELIAWNIEINADRVSAMGMLMILKEDRAKLTSGMINQKKDAIVTDKFWNKHFTNFNKSLF
jgi:hypothetical protein